MVKFSVTVPPLVTVSILADDPAAPVVTVPACTVVYGPPAPCGPCGPCGMTNEICCDGALPVMLTAAVVAVVVVTLPTVSEFAGPTFPCTPCGPWTPVAPCGSTRFRVCVGAVPVIVAAASAPVTTVPIDRVVAGPTFPCGPIGPAAPDGDTVTATVSPVLATTLGPVWLPTVTVMLMEILP